MIKIIDDLIFNLDNDRVSGMVLVDYLEAFDMIDHTLLLKKPEVYGLNRDSLQWLTSYLKEIKDVIWLSWETNSQMSLLFVMVFPRDPYLAPSYLSPLSMTYRFESFQQELICMPTLTSSTSYSSFRRLEGTLNLSIAEIVDWAASNMINY